ncbi:MAG: hypothetical protein AAFR54_17040, partial [Planctomycetota bacterium]
MFKQATLVSALVALSLPHAFAAPTVRAPQVTGARAVQGKSEAPNAATQRPATQRPATRQPATPGAVSAGVGSATVGGQIAGGALDDAQGVQVPGPKWETKRNHPNDPTYANLPYISLFVAAPGRPEAGVNQFVHLGADVIAANNPAPGGPDGGLYALMPGGKVRKLFPLDVHDTAPGLIDTPLGQLEKGAVVEPNISEDGTRVYFGWFHDQTWKKNGGGWLSQELSYKGCDLYSIDLTDLIASANADVSALPIQRLTHKQYTGFHKNNVQETLASRSEWAINPSTAGFSSEAHGTCNMHMIEMRTEDGLKAVFVSDRARVGNSNADAHKPNHNFNLYQADILPDGTLGAIHQQHYFTTTSALSPENLRDGFTFSYQSSTENFRRWDLQAVTSNGKWSPLLGYAQASELYHFGTLVTEIVDGEFHDSFLGVKYYNLNNAGSGQLHLIDMDDAGINEFRYAPGQGTQPEQITELISLDVTIEDGPSPLRNVNGEDVFIGKLTTPRAGRLGGEYLAAWTPTSANRWIADVYGQRGQFDFHIVYRPNLDPFHPEQPFDPLTDEGLATLVDESSGSYQLLWPTPVLSWRDRFGTPFQDYSPSIVDPASTVLRGEPYADVGTSAIYNTDIRPWDCFRGTGGVPYSPNNLTNVEEIDFDQSYEGLRYVQDPNDICQYLLPETALGLQINITSNRVDWQSRWRPAYETDTTYLTWSRGKKEASRILGVYDVDVENVADKSAIARIPADVPFDFHLIDRQYGMKLVDVRSWHGLQPREKRVDCGGCHQHERGTGIPFGGTEASLREPLDMVTGTRFYAYDEDCKPTLQSAPDATIAVPEWKLDVWPGFDQHCSSCHNSSVSSNGAALAALDYVDEE